MDTFKTKYLCAFKGFGLGRLLMSLRDPAGSWVSDSLCTQLHLNIFPRYAELFAVSQTLAIILYPSFYPLHSTRAASSWKLRLCLCCF